MLLASMAPQHILTVAQPQEDCAWCWPLLHPSQPYPEHLSSTCCAPHSAWLINLAAERRARQRATTPEVTA